MRPNEHKKKKNAAYKKKHCIDSSGKGKHETKTKVNTSTPSPSGASASSSYSSVRSQDRIHKSHGRKGRFHSSGSESKSDEEEEEKRVSFRRRQIVSNWQKYDLEPDADEKSSTKGEDYQTLLNMTGEAMSHFRFKDEKDWEDEAEELTKESTCPFLSLDPTELAESLACIPTHQLLGVSEELFTAEQITAMVDESGKHKARMSDLTQTKNENAADNVLFTSAEHDASLELTHSDLNTDINPSGLLSSTLRSSHTSAQSNKERLSEFPDTSPTQNESQNVTPHKKRDIDSATYSCLVADSPCPKPTANEQRDTNQPLSLQDEDLDSLLEMSVPEEATDKAKSGSENNSGSKGKEAPGISLNTESAELEDWLDSVLED